MRTVTDSVDDAAQTTNQESSAIADATANRSMSVSPQELLSSKEFRRLAAKRWRVSLSLTAALFVLYYGFILLIATNRALLATPVGGATTLGILFGIAVLVLSWVLTAVYVVWANRHYDPEAKRLRDLLRS